MQIVLVGMQHYYSVKSCSAYCFNNSIIRTSREILSFLSGLFLSCWSAQFYKLSIVQLDLFLIWRLLWRLLWPMARPCTTVGITRQGGWCRPRRMACRLTTFFILCHAVKNASWNTPVQELQPA